MSDIRVRRRPILGLLTLVLSVFALGCPGEDNGTDPETPTISVSITPTSASVEQGSSTDVDVEVTGSGGFTGSATISVENVPSGVTGTVGNVQSSGVTTTATVTIAVGETVAPGNYNLTVRGSGSGVTAVTATFALTVTAAPAYELSATPSQLMIEQSGEATTSIGIARTNFTGEVTLAVEGAPSGMTTSFDTNPVGGDAAVLTVAPDGMVAPGAYTLTVRGTATGLTDRTVTVGVAVTEPAVPDYVLSVSPTALTINQGASEDATVTITRSNFSGAVTLVAEGLPADVAATFSVNPVSGNTSEMTLTVGASATPGTSTVTIRGTATGIVDKTVTLELTVEEAASYTLTLSPLALTVDQGASGTVNVNLNRTNFTEAVTLSLENAPPGVTGTFDPNPASGDASVLTIDVAASTTPDTYGLTVRGTSASLSDETASLALVVTEVAGFSLGAITPMSIEQGASDSRVVSITRTGGFTGDVTVTVTGLPAGITATVDPVTTSGNSTNVTIDVAASVAVGSYQATVAGNATGLPEATQTLDIAVTTASGQQVSLDFSVCAVGQRPAWLAYQDGSGPWTPLTGVGDTYTFNVSAPTAAIAAAIAPGGFRDVIIYYATRDEFVTVDLEELCDTLRTGKTVNAAVAGIVSGEGASLTLGDAGVDVSLNQPIQFTGVPDGVLDLIAYKWTLTGSERMYIERDLNPADGADLGTIDFAGSSAFDPAFATITIDVGGGLLLGGWSMEYATSPSPGLCYYAWLDDAPYTSTTFQVGGAPAARQETGDYHYLTVTDGFFTVSETFATLADRTLAYGPALPTPTITDVSGTAAYRRLRVQLTLPAEYDGAATLTMLNQSRDRRLNAIATQAWRGGQVVDLEVPDFTGLAGWDDDWAPTSASSTDWTFEGYGWTGDECTEGAGEVSATAAGSVG